MPEQHLARSMSRQSSRTNLPQTGNQDQFSDRKEVEVERVVDRQRERERERERIKARRASGTRHYSRDGWAWNVPNTSFSLLPVLDGFAQHG